MSASIEVVAVLSKKVFQAERNDFLVAEFIDVDSAKRFRASGKIALSDKADAKQKYRLLGRWESTPKYGQTFVTLYCEAVRPTEVKGIIPFLSNNIKGIGEATAKKLIDHFHIQEIDVLVSLCREESAKIYEFFGEKKKKIADNLIFTMLNDEVFRSIMIFLHEHNIADRFAKRIYEKYGSTAIEKLTENPYRLISDFRQVGFFRADAIAQKLGIDKLSPYRIEAAFVYALEAALEEGHCCLPRNILIEKTRDLLGGKTDTSFSQSFMLESLRNIYRKNRETGEHTFAIRELPRTTMEAALRPEEILFYLPEILTMENTVHQCIEGLLEKGNIGKEFKEKKVQEELLTGKTLESLFPDIPWDKLSPEQKNAVEMSLSERLMILTGGPGCGKTFVLKAIFSLQKALNRKIALCAPTGLAAKRMGASIGERACTLHKLLGIGQKYDQKNASSENTEEGEEMALKNFDIVIVDESSMLSLDLLHTLLTELGPNRRLLLVGDVDQLPSVGAGNCLRDLIQSRRIPLTKLTRIFRQSSQSPIPIAARQIISGEMPTWGFVSHSPCFPQIEPLSFLPCTPETFLEHLLTFLKETVEPIFGLDPIRDVQILVPMRRGTAGQENINKFLQQELNPPQENKPESPLPFSGTLRQGDKVIQTRNNYELRVFNGDLGFCKKITKTKEKLEVEIEFPDRLVIYEDEEVDDLQLCYAMTVHKSQGSEFPLCIIPMFNQYYTMLDRNLLYTALTRASKYALILGEQWAIKKAVGSQNAIQRFTALEALLRQNAG